MRKDYLLNLRKLAVMAGMVAGISTLGSCGSTDIKSDTNKISVTMDDEMKKEIARVLNNETSNDFSYYEDSVAIYKSMLDRIEAGNEYESLNVGKKAARKGIR